MFRLAKVAVRGRPTRQVKWYDRQHVGKYLVVELGAREGRLKAGLIDCKKG